MLGKHFKGIWGWLRELCCPPQTFGWKYRKGQKASDYCNKNTRQWGVRQGWFADSRSETTVFKKARRSKEVHTSACCQCLLQEGDTNKLHAKTEAAGWTRGWLLLLVPINLVFSFRVQAPGFDRSHLCLSRRKNCHAFLLFQKRGTRV